MSRNQLRTLSNDSRSVTSYTTITPSEPERDCTLDCDHNVRSIDTSIIHGRDGSIAFLAGGVPNLQFHEMAIQLDRLDLEVNANRGEVRFRECSIRKATRGSKWISLKCRIPLN